MTGVFLFLAGWSFANVAVAVWRGVADVIVCWSAPRIGWELFAAGAFLLLGLGVL